MTTTNFKVGQKVVCVDDSDCGPYFKCPMKKGEIFLIRNINSCVCGKIRIDVGIVSPTRGALCSTCWHVTKLGVFLFRPSRFRPLTYQSCSATLAAASSVLTIETSDMPITNPSPKPEKKEVEV